MYLGYPLGDGENKTQLLLEGVLLFLFQMLEEGLFELDLFEE